MPSRIPLSRTAACTSSVMSVTVRPPTVRSCVSRWKTFTGDHSAARSWCLERRTGDLNGCCTEPPGAGNHRFTGALHVGGSNFALGGILRLRERIPFSERMSEMTKRMLLICALALAIVPAALAASPDATKNASSACTALKAQMGTSFTSAYATFGACVSKYAQLEQQNVTSAQASCTALQAATTFAADHGGKTFDQFYGTGKSGKNAFGNCVSAHAKASSQAEQQGRQNPSRSCRAQRSANSAAFAQTYGKNANDRNAFGKCVSQVASKQAQNELH